MCVPIINWCELGQKKKRKNKTNRETRTHRAEEGRVVEESGERQPPEPRKERERGRERGTGCAFEQDAVVSYPQDAEQDAQRVVTWYRRRSWIAT